MVGPNIELPFIVQEMTGDFTKMILATAATGLAAIVALTQPLVLLIKLLVRMGSFIGGQFLCLGNLGVAGTQEYVAGNLSDEVQGLVEEHYIPAGDGEVDPEGDGGVEEMEENTANPVAGADDIAAADDRENPSTDERDPTGDGKENVSEEGAANPAAESAAAAVAATGAAAAMLGAASAARSSAGSQANRPMGAVPIFPEADVRQGVRVFSRLEDGEITEQDGVSGWMDQYACAMSWPSSQGGKESEPGGHGLKGGGVRADEDCYTEGASCLRRDENSRGVSCGYAAEAALLTTRQEEAPQSFAAAEDHEGRLEVYSITADVVYQECRGRGLTGSVKPSFQDIQGERGPDVVTVQTANMIRKIESVLLDVAEPVAANAPVGRRPLPLNHPSLKFIESLCRVTETVPVFAASTKASQEAVPVTEAGVCV